MRKLIAKLPSHHLIKEADKSGLSFFTTVGFARQSLCRYHFSSPETCRAKEYPGSLPAVRSQSIDIRGIYRTAHIRSQTDGNGISRYTDPANFFSYREPEKSIHINRDRFANIKSKTFT